LLCYKYADRLTYPALELFDMILDIPTDLSISKLCPAYLLLVQI